ncbi:YfhE family protein [Sporosarcina sp. A2]
MTEKKEPHETLTDKNNNLSSAQEVEYASDFKKADNATKDADKRTTK